MRVDLDSETAAALERRADLKLARLFVRAANEDQRIIAADYYPVVIGSIPGEYSPSHWNSSRRLNEQEPGFYRVGNSREGALPRGGSSIMARWEAQFSEHARREN